MYRLLFIGFIAFFASCEEVFINEAAIATQPDNVPLYYLSFDAIEYDYSHPENQDAVSVYAEQDMDLELSFKDLTTLDRYLFFAYGVDLPSDSIAIMGNLRFVQTPNVFEQEIVDLEFVLLESLENLTLNTDSTYSYISNEILYQSLVELEWGNIFDTGNPSPSQILLTFPFSVEDESLPHSLLTSYMFYFPHEDLTLSSINYIEEKDAIELAGNFTVDLKMLSCGFYSTHLVSDAEFIALIK